MKKARLVSIVAAFACGLSLFAPSQSFATNEENWAFVQSVGGMKLGNLERHADEWRLTVDIDVTGSRAITARPTLIDSGFVCENMQAEFRGNDIYISLFVGPPWLGGRNGGCPAISLGQPEAGTYTIYYGGMQETPVQIGTVKIPEF